jgi:hypothetical protein
MDFDKEEVTSGLTTFLAEGAVIADGTLIVPKGAEKSWDKIEKRGPAEKKKQQKDKKKDEGREQGRLLAPSEPDYRSILAVRVVAADSATSADLQTLSDDIFGTNGSAVNLRERFETCSYGDTQMLPYTGETPSGVSIQNGVVEVTISNVVNEVANSGIRISVLSELSSYLDIPNLANEFDHIMLCLPPGTSGSWIAYGACCFSRKLAMPLSSCLRSHTPLTHYTSSLSLSLLRSSKAIWAHISQCTMTIGVGIHLLRCMNLVTTLPLVTPVKDRTSMATSPE